MYKRKIYSIFALAVAIVMSLGAVTANAASGVNGAPTVENLEFDTYRGVSFGGQLKAADPEGDEVTFEITTQPTKGAVELEDSGRFVYTPEDGKKGKDYFGYKAKDSEGNVSQEGTVIIKISRKAACVTYSDMSGDAGYYAAVMLAEKEIFTGEKLGAAYFFSPDATLSRGEFLSMCMEMSGKELLSGVMSTGFSDDSDIPVWEKPYISTAVMNGSISGYSVSGGAVFDSAAAITKAEASVMLNNIIGITDVSEDNTALTPVWAAQSVANLSSKGIISDSAALSETLTRSDAAQMLVGAMNIANEK